MIFNSLDIYTARKKLRLKGETASTSVFYTLWHSEVLILHFNRSKSEIESIFCQQELSSDDVEILKNIICDFYNEII